MSLLRDAGLRPTRQRIVIAKILFDGRNRHVTAENLSDEIIKSGHRVAAATIYNTLNQFTDVGLLRRVMIHNEHSVFDTNTDHHHHFFDVDTKKLIDIPADEVVLSRLPSVPDGQRVCSVDVVVHVENSNR